MIKEKEEAPKGKKKKEEAAPQGVPAVEGEGSPAVEGEGVPAPKPWLNNPQDER